MQYFVLSLQLHKAQAFVWMFEAAQLVKQDSAFTESKGLLSSKRLPTTGLCSEPQESIIHLHIGFLYFFSTHSNRMFTENNFER